MWLIDNPSDRFRRHCVQAWALGLAIPLLLAWDLSGADLWVMARLGSAEGFALRHDWLLETVLHDRARQVLLAVFFAAIALMIRPMGRWQRLTRLERAAVLAGITLNLLVVNLLKRGSETSCPWDLMQFGGVASYVSHWDWSTVDGGNGHCFPGGHASSALAFLALAMPWLRQTDPDDRRFGQALALSVLLVGVALGGVQTLRGAHYPSHTGWTAVLCWGMAWAVDGLAQRVAHASSSRPSRRAYRT